MKLSWQDVLDCKEWAGHIDIMYKRTLDAKYQFFTFNGVVYQINKYAQDMESNYTKVGNISEVF